MREIQTQPLRHLLDGRPAVSLVPVIPADAGPALREGLRRRRVAAATGRCPCGARRPALTAVQLAAAQQGTAWAPIPHEVTCPAHDDRLGPEIERWKEGA